MGRPALFLVCLLETFRTVLSQLTTRLHSTNTEQLVFYQSGVGSETDFNGDYLGTKGTISLTIHESSEASTKYRH